MDTSILIMGLLLLLIVIIPLYFILRPHKINPNLIDSLFAQYSQNNRYRFTLVATQNRKALAIDPNNRGLLFIDFNLKEPYVAFQDLTDTKGCAVATANPLGTANPIKKVEWVFFSKNGIGQGRDIVFHDADRPYVIPVYPHEELKLAEEWQQIIDKHL